MVIHKITISSCLVVAYPDMWLVSKVSFLNLLSVYTRKSGNEGVRAKLFPIIKLLSLQLKRLFSSFTLGEIIWRVTIEASRATVEKTVSDDLHYWKVWARWMSRLLSDAPEKSRMAVARKFLGIFQSEGEKFFARIIGDKTWVNHSVPEEKQYGKHSTYCRGSQ